MCGCCSKYSTISTITERSVDNTPAHVMHEDINNTLPTTLVQEHCYTKTIQNAGKFTSSDCNN